MRDLFLEDGATETAQPAEGASTGPLPAAQTLRKSLEGKYVCPFCGSVNLNAGGACPRCTMENTPAARKATKSRIGPWYVLQTRNPAAPGMKFETLLAFVKKGRIKARSVVRGPTTHQLWRFAAHVKGLSREFGVCYSCGGDIERSAALCPQCNRLQDPPPNPDVLLETPAEEPKAPAAPVYRELKVEDADIIVPTLGRPAATVDDAASSQRPPTLAAPAPVTLAPPRGEATTPPVEPTIPRVASTPLPLGPPPASDSPRKKGDAFLSARDLAAAFKLDFAPGAEFHPDAEVDEFAGGRPRGSWKRKALVLLVLAAGAYGAWLYIDPSMRTRTMDWLENSYNTVRSSISRSSDPGKNSSLTPPSTTGGRPIYTRQPGARGSTGSDAGATIQAPTSTIATPKSAATTPPTATAPPVAPREASQAHETPRRTEAQPATRPAPSEMKAPPATNPGQEVKGPAHEPKPIAWPTDEPVLTAAQAMAKSKELYRSGIEAQANGSAAEAIKSLEQIKKLPRNVWQSDLDLRIAQLRKDAQRQADVKAE